MVKVKKLIKFSSKSSKNVSSSDDTTTNNNSNNNNNTASASSSSSAAANARAEYYASRNAAAAGSSSAGGLGGSGTTNNPFAAPSRPAPSMRNVSNPFGDDSDSDSDDDAANNGGRNNGRNQDNNDSGEDDPLAGFGRRKVKQGKQAPPPPSNSSGGGGGGGSNPFDSPPPPSSKKSSRTMNPFGDDDDSSDEEEVKQAPKQSKSRTGQPPPSSSLQTQKQQSQRQPSSQLQQQQQQQMSFKKKKPVNNPFDDDGSSSNNNNTNNSSKATTATITTTTTATNGRANRLPSKPIASTANNNPFGDDDNDDIQPSPEEMMAMKGSMKTSTTSRPPLSNNNNNMSSITSSSTTTGSAGAKSSFLAGASAAARPSRSSFSNVVVNTSTASAPIATNGNNNNAFSTTTATATTAAAAAAAASRPKRSTMPNSKSNPFDIDDDDNGMGGVPKPLISKPDHPSQKEQIHYNPFDSNATDSGGGASGGGGVTNSSSEGPPTGPKRNRWTFGNTKMANNNNNHGGGGDTDSTRPILSGMDEDSVNNVNQSTNASASGNAAGLASWLRLNKKEDEDGLVGGAGGGAGGGSNGISMGGSGGGGGMGGNSGHHHHHSNNNNQHHNNSSSHNNNNSGNSGNSNREQRNMKKNKAPKKKKCRALVTPWPFDNYHEEQERMYEELASRAASDYHTHDGGGGGGGGNNGGANGGGYYSGSDDDDDEKKDDLLGTGGVSSRYYERPEELPSIKEAVNDLALVDFEKKAEERAITIVSTWLFDAGLIDELLVNGAMSFAAAQQQPQQQQQQGNASVDGSVKTSEGVEIGAHGFPLVGAEGAQMKMDKETNKLRGAIQRDLSIINARLNDGVAASGLEVQELVNAVGATKDDIGRLRELTTYISDGQISDRDEFLLAKYPYLRKAINARRNIARCFRELEFFSQIPSTCERLRDDLHGGEWTEEEWNTIRNVSMEHVELEILLVEAENSMKGAHHFNDDMVDSFLDSHVQNVWELGDEIRMRILSGIGTAFDLAINNPAGIVALVEAVEVYEQAAEMVERKRQETSTDVGNLRFTNMRAAALEQLYQDFELRGVEMFRGVHEQAADMAEEEDATNSQFTAVLKAATELVTEIDIVKHQMSPCFAPHWHVEALWSSCVAHVCSNHIVQQIGGPDGQNLPELTITQLLELVAWVEYFRETIEETFPEVASKRDTKKTYFEERPDLFAGDKRTVNMENATESLAWVNNMLWEVHRLAQEEFLVRTRSQTDEWLDKVYGSETVKNQSSEGKLTTSLCEDVFSFSSVQLRTIRERLSKKSDALILAVCIILSHMRSKQVHSRDNFLEDLETCCAASNDFTRMSEKCEDIMSELLSQCEFSEDMEFTLEASSNELMGVYSSDAVYAARSVHIYVFDPIEEEIGTRLFEQDWEENMPGNDLAVSLVRTLEDFHEDLETYMDSFMVVKGVMSLMSATVIFYVKCLLMRAEKHRNNKKPFFGDNQRALNRMTGDVQIMRDYFEGLVPQMPALKKNIEKDFEIFSTIHELMSIAAELSVSDAEDFILMLQKRVRDVSITKHIVGDLWHLVAPTGERHVWELVESMEDTLVAIAPADDALALEVNDRSYVKGLRLDEMAVSLYVKSRRNRPIKATAVENMVKNWKTTWSASAGAIDEGHDED